MKTCKVLLTLLVAAALLLPAGFAFSQMRSAEIADAEKLLGENPTFNNRLRLGTLQYLEGVDMLDAGNTEGAVEMMQAGVWTLEDGQGQIPESHPVFEEARYGLAYGALQNDDPYTALAALDQLVAASPNFDKARYLLGVTLSQLSGAKSQARAVTVFTALAQDGEAPYAEMGQHAALRMAYNLSTLTHAQGDAAGALELLGGTSGTLGEGAAASEAEAAAVQFAMGAYLLDTGDTFGAMDSFESLHASNPGYELSNGVALAGVLSNTYYNGGVEQLELGGESANRLAVNLFNNAADVGDPAALDVRHGLAVAHTNLGELDEAAKQLAEIVKQDASYYERIKAQ